jgi:hypothetical protein
MPWLSRSGRRFAGYARKPSQNHPQAPHADYLPCIAYYIAFGPHGPRRPAPPDEGRKVFLLSMAVIGAACVVFAITRMFANPARPRTMTKEWQEATEEYMKVRWFRDVEQYHSPRIYANATCYIVTRHGADYWIQGDDGAEPTGVQGSPRRGRRMIPIIVNKTCKQHQIQPYYVFLGQRFLWYCLHENHQLGRILRSTVASRCWAGNCHIRLPVYRNFRGIFQFESSLARLLWIQCVHTLQSPLHPHL